MLLDGSSQAGTIFSLPAISVGLFKTENGMRVELCLD